MITINGVSKCIAEWAESSSVKEKTIAERIRCGWDAERAVFGGRHKRLYTTPEGQFKTLQEVQDFYGMSSSGVHARFVNKAYEGWEIKENVRSKIKQR